MPTQREVVIENSLALARATGSEKVFIFLNSIAQCKWFSRTPMAKAKEVVLVLPGTLLESNKGKLPGGITLVKSWSGNQTRFSRVKYSFLHGVVAGIITPESKVVCVLGPWGSDHLDTITIHDLALSWSQDFPFEPQSLLNKTSFNTVLAMVDIALDVGAMGREGKAVGTTFVVGDSETVLKNSHQAVFNPFKGYPKKERLITLPEVVESVKELAQLDGAVVVSGTGVVEAAGRHLDAHGPMTRQLRGLGARHRAAAGITKASDAVAIVVSESTGRITIFDNGRIVSTLEPVISRRLV